jgi:phenylpyruvate tautomerase PptA (4-oxalocrotonate tautomerase family)
MAISARIMAVVTMVEMHVGWRNGTAKVPRSPAMPFMFVTLTPGAYDAQAQDRLAASLTEVAARAESLPDRPGPRSRALVCLHELPAGRFYSAGVAADRSLCGVFMTLYVTAGVLDGRRKAEFAAGIQAAAEKCAPQGRTVVTSAVIVEVAEGQWAQRGRIVRLPDVVGIAEFEHLAGAAL